MICGVSSKKGSVPQTRPGPSKIRHILEVDLAHALGRNPGWNRREVFPAAWLEAVGPTSVHLAKHAVLQWGIFVDARDAQLDEVNLALLKKLPSVVRQVAWNIANLHLFSFGAYSHRLRIDLIL